MAKRHIPDYIINRKKQGFAIPVTKWLKSDLKDTLLNYTNKNYIKNQGLFQHDFIETLVQNHLSERWDNKKLLWNLLVFQLWYEKYKPSIKSNTEELGLNKELITKF